MSKYKPKTEKPALSTPYGRVREYTTPTGIDVQLYGISSLAAAVGRTTQTIRKWEIAGTIPPTPFIMKRGCFPNRMYTEEMISLVAELAERHRVTNGYPIPRAFSVNVYKGWNKLGKKYFGDEYVVKKPPRKEQT